MVDATTCITNKRDQLTPIEAQGQNDKRTTAVIFDCKDESKVHVINGPVTINFANNVGVEEFLFNNKIDHTGMVIIKESEHTIVTIYDESGIIKSTSPGLYIFDETNILTIRQIDVLNKNKTLNINAPIINHPLNLPLFYAQKYWMILAAIIFFLLCLCCLCSSSLMSGSSNKPVPSFQQQPQMFYVPYGMQPNQ